MTNPIDEPSVIAVNVPDAVTTATIDVGQTGPAGPAGAQGAQGVPGPANTLTIGTVSQGTAAATITGSAPNQVLNLTLPQGATGPANTLSIGTVSTLSAGSSATASITGTAPNQTLNLGIPQGAAGATKNATVTISSPLSDYWTHLEILDDGSTSTSWPNRFEAAYTPQGGTRGLTTYLNEYGELRGEPAKSNTVPARWFTKHAPTDPAHTVNVVEVMDDRTTRTLLFSVDASGNVKAPNLPGRITVASTAPSSPATGDVWIDTSS